MSLDPQRLLGQRFRTRGDVEIVPFDRLSPEERRTLVSLLADADCYGIARSTLGGMTLKAIDRETALLLLTLRSESALPSYLRRATGERCAGFVADLVLSDLLEVSVDGADFVSGPAARALLASSEGTPASPLARLSRQALAYGAAAHLGDARELARRLYWYNRMPFTARWRRLFANEDTVARLIGIEGVNRFGRWTEVPGAAWHLWQGEHRRHPERDQLKLYISPHPDDLPAAFRAAVATFAECGVPSFKAGRGAAGMLRPDKLVAYVDDEEQLHAVSEALAARLQGIRGQGVPFTAAFHDELWISWGADPPVSERVVEWQGPSWRAWVVERLAAALVQARDDADGGVAFALARLRCEGIAGDTWVPGGQPWKTH